MNFQNNRKVNCYIPLLGISEMFIPSFCYWNNIMRYCPGDIQQDTLGMPTIKLLEKNIAELKIKSNKE